MPHRDQEIAMLRRELEMLMGERQSLLRIAGASAVLIASLDSKQLPVGAIEAADQLLDQIQADSRTLLLQPKMGRARDELAAGLRS